MFIFDTKINNIAYNKIMEFTILTTSKRQVIDITPTLNKKLQEEDFY